MGKPEDSPPYFYPNFQSSFLQSLVLPHIWNSNSFVPVLGLNSLLQTLQIIMPKIAATNSGTIML